MKELSIVELLEDLPEHNLKAGDQGCVVMVYGGGEAFEVEFSMPLVTTIHASKLKKAETVKTDGTA